MPPTERDHAALADAVASGRVQAQTGIGPSLHPEPDFSGSLEKIVLGAARGIVLSPGERERTAFDESGHALLGMLTPGADPAGLTSSMLLARLGVEHLLVSARPQTSTCPRPMS